MFPFACFHPYPLGHKRSIKISILTQLVGLKSEKSWFLCCRLSLGCFKALDEKVIVIVYYAYNYSKTKSKFQILYVVRLIRLENTVVWLKFICIMIEVIRINLYFTSIGSLMGLESKIPSLIIVVMAHHKNVVSSYIYGLF